MTLKQKLERERSELREKLATLAGKGESLTDDERAEMAKCEARLMQSEAELRAAILAEPDPAEVETRTEPDAEHRERAALRGRASLGRYLARILAGAAVDGAERELREAAGSGAPNEIPLELWDVPRPEHRADAPTGAPSTVGVNLDSIAPAVFAASVVPRLGVAMPMVPSGTYAVPVISTSLTGSAKAKGGALESTAAAFTVSSMTPKRVGARLSLRIEDVAAAGTNLEAALRENLSMALAAELDDQGLNGNGTAPNLSGLFQALTDPSAAANVLTYDSVHATLGGEIDGLYAESLMDLSLVVNPATAGKFVSTFQAATNYKGERSIWDTLRGALGGLFTNARMPAGASNVSAAIVHKRGRALRTAVCPTWATLAVDDIYSDSASGERHFTLSAILGDVKVLYPEAYAQLSFKTA